MRNWITQILNIDYEMEMLHYFYKKLFAK